MPKIATAWIAVLKASFVATIATLGAAPALAAEEDPWEGVNRAVFRFNDTVDTYTLKPLAQGYQKVTPGFLEDGIGNVFSNLGDVVVLTNDLLQGKVRDAGIDTSRILFNTTFGVLGFFDVATRMGLHKNDEDFGQTLGIWGWQNSRYLELPLFGPRTLRDAFGIVGDAPLSPTRQLNDDQTRWALQGLQLVDLRTQLFVVDRMREGAADDYALVRDAWMQRRQYQIFGDLQSDDDALPDYLLDDEALPTVPADAIPVIPGVPLN